MTNRNAIGLAAAVALSVAGCSHQDGPASTDRSPTTLRIGFGSTTGTETGQVVDHFTHETLVVLNGDGKPAPSLAQSWSVSDDGLTWRFTIRPGVTFHDGTPFTANEARAAILRSLPPMLGASYGDIRSIDAVSASELVFNLRDRLTFLPDTLAVPIRHPVSRAGTGPFLREVRQEEPNANARPIVELMANDRYHGGRPSIDRVVIEPYRSVRSAWADMLRDRVDMLYEVGGDAHDLVQRAKSTRLITFPRPYAVLIVLNTRRPGLGNPAVRRALNLAINRQEIVTTGMDGLGRPADGPVWPDLWANAETRPRFEYQPSPIRANGAPLKFALLYSDPTHERIALLVQRQLQSVGVQVTLEETTVRAGQERATRGDFDAWLADMGLGPAFFRQMVFWQSGSPYAGGGYANKDVDAAFVQIRRAKNDEEYRAGVLAFQRAIALDPPAIFLAWTERARAVSTRFEVPNQPGRDILRAVSLWRPAVMPQLASRN